MRITSTLIIAITLLAGSSAIERMNAQVNSNDNNIAVMDNCRPGDPTWAEIGGCALKPHQGDVPRAEFGMLLTSPLSSAVVGHPSWRNEPSHITANRGRTVHVQNEGGRGHTFTKVANFGGGAVPGLNIGLTKAPECPATVPAITDLLPPGATQRFDNLPVGLHKFQCCIHPWMRATVRVE